MTTSITLGATTITPVEVLGYQSTRQTGNLLHVIVARSDVDVTFKAAGLRNGTLKMLFLTETDALTAESLCCSVGVFQLTSTDLPGIAMYFVPSGAIAKEFDDDSSVAWTVSVDYQEVLP